MNRHYLIFPFFFALAAASTLTPIAVDASPPKPAPKADSGAAIQEPGNFGELVKGKIYHGAIPSGKAQFEALHKYGVKTIIDLEGWWLTAAFTAGKQKRAEDAGFKYSGRYFDPVLNTSEAAINSILEDIANPANQPVYIHCLRGNDRTMLIVGLFMVKYMGRTFKDAEDTMKRHGFARGLTGPFLLGLKAYWGTHKRPDQQHKAGF